MSWREWIREGIMEEIEDNGGDRGWPGKKGKRGGR